MSTITTIASSDLITNSRTVLNTNFSNLNTDKIETSTLDTDTALTANSDSKIATQKAVKAYIDAKSLLSITSEVTTGTTASLTTTGSQRVVVWAKGHHDVSGTANNTITLKYNGVQKDVTILNVQSVAAGDSYPFALMYTETPGAGTQDITVTADIGTPQDVVIMVLKFPI